MTDFDSANYDITYDPALFHVTDVNDGSIGATIIPVTFWGLIPPSTQGTVRIINNVVGAGGASGQGTLAVINFTVNCSNCGWTDLNFTGMCALYDNASAEITATWFNDSMYIFCPVPSSSPTAMPTATPTTTSTSTATSTVTATPTPTITMTVPPPTPTPTPTLITEVFFEETSYVISNDADGCEDFYTTINMTAPIELFFAAQWVLEWDCSLFYIRAAATQNNGAGRLYNGTSPNPNWTLSTAVGCNPTGSGCPNTGSGDGGRANFLVDWGNYYHLPSGFGVNVTAPPGSPPYPAEGELCTITWRTSGPGCWGSAVNNGSTDIRFAPTMKMVGFLFGAYEYDEHGRTVNWSNSSIQVGP